MRSLWRTLNRDLVRDLALVCVAVLIVGVSYGAITVASGLPVWLPMLMSVVVYAGAAQFLVVGLIAAGGNPIAAVIAGLLVNTRHVPFGFAVGDVLGKSWAQRIVGSHMLTDETVAFTLRQDDPARRRATYWLSGTCLALSWNIGTVIGAFGGTLISDTNVFGLDAAFPAVLLALALPMFSDGPTRRAAGAGVVIALATAPFLPAGLPVLLALVGVLASLGGDRAAKQKVAP